MEIGRIAIRCVFTFVVLLALVRLSGKRTVSEGKTFDFVLALVLAVPTIALALRARTAWIERRPVTAQATRSDPSRRRGFRRRRGSS